MFFNAVIAMKSQIMNFKIIIMNGEELGRKRLQCKCYLYVSLDGLIKTATKLITLAIRRIRSRYFRNTCRLIYHKIRCIVLY
jgi:hypothetical protein